MQNKFEEDSSNPPDFVNTRRVGQFGIHGEAEPIDGKELGRRLDGKSDCYGVPLRRKATIDESRRCEATSQLIREKTHTHYRIPLLPVSKSLSSAQAFFFQTLILNCLDCDYETEVGSTDATLPYTRHRYVINC